MPFCMEFILTPIERCSMTHETLLPLILSGPPRSGTTMFSALLDGHPEINWFLDEGFFFEHLHNHGSQFIQDFVKASGFGTEKLIEGIRDRSLMPPTYKPPSDFPSLKYPWSEDAFRRVLQKNSQRSARDLWVMLRDAYMAGLGYQPRRYVTMKAADYGRSVFGALDNFSEARGVIIVREPVAMLNSLKVYREKHSRNLLTWPTLCEAVVAMNKLAAAVDRYERSRLRVFRYEDVVKSAEPELRALCGWLGIEFDPVLLIPSMMGQPWTNNSSFAAGASGVSDIAERKMALSEAEREFISSSLDPFAQRFGYG
jgi:hypothetical protein